MPMLMRVDSNGFFDGFPCDPAQITFAIQKKIDADLRNAEALRNTAAPPAMLYPEYMATPREERQTWLTPALERFAWN
jgi:hypothetical protein